MAITHVIRGEEWINSAPKHRLLYDYLGWEAPVLAHLPLLRNPDRSKLSKRKNPTGINYYRRMGYLPEALVNFLGLMGHSMPEGEEIFDVQAFIEAFSLERITLGAPVFDQEKLAWLNGQWLRGLSDEAFADRVMAWGLNREALMPLVPLIKPRTERLCDLAPMVGYLLGARRTLAPEDFEGLALEGEALLEVLQFALWRFEALSDWTRPQLVATVEALAEELELKIRVLLAPLFVALSGQAVSLPLYDSLVFLGPDLARARLREGLEALGGVSKKAGKRLEKRYAELGLRGAGEGRSAES